jgi:23S rRNA pseudouridine1911/1915/1917 synthase
MEKTPLHVLYEDNHLLAINKPAPLPTMGVPEDTTSLIDLAKQYIKVKYDKPGNVYLGVVSRLDAPVTGVVMLARTSKAASRVSDQFRKRTVHKRYWALVNSPVAPPSNELTSWLKVDKRHRKVRVSRAGIEGAQEARLRYETVLTNSRQTLLQIDLQTGRKHQIRVQLAEQGHPIIGDRKYGNRSTFAQGIALHARQLELRHPVKNETLRITAPIPDYWPRFVCQFADEELDKPPTLRD